MKNGFFLGMVLISAVSTGNCANNDQSQLDQNSFSYGMMAPVVVSAVTGALSYRFMAPVILEKLIGVYSSALAAGFGFATATILLQACWLAKSRNYANQWKKNALGFQSTINDKQTTIQNQQTAINEKDQTISGLQRQLNDPEKIQSELNSLRNQVANLQTDVRSKQTTINQQTQRIRELEQQAANLGNEANGKDAEINKQKQQIQGLTQQVENLNEQIQNLNQQIERLTPKKPANEFTRPAALSQCLYTIKGNTITCNQGRIENVNCKNPEQITEIILNNGVTRVESDAFSNFSNVDTIVINCLPSVVSDSAFVNFQCIQTVKTNQTIVKDQLNRIFGFDNSFVDWQIEKQGDYTVFTVQNDDDDIFDDDE